MTGWVQYQSERRGGTRGGKFGKHKGDSHAEIHWTIVQVILAGWSLVSWPPGADDDGSSSAQLLPYPTAKVVGAAAKPEARTNKPRYAKGEGHSMSLEEGKVTGTSQDEA